MKSNQSTRIDGTYVRQSRLCTSVLCQTAGCKHITIPANVRTQVVLALAARAGCISLDSPIYQPQNWDLTAIPTLKEVRQYSSQLQLVNSVTASASFLAEISVSSPRKIIIFII